MIADHIRAISFTIADGQLPSNTGAGYVIRRILRRGIRYYYSYLDYKQPLLHQLVQPLALQFKYVFTELYDQAEFVAKVIREEEEAFLRTLEKGLRLFYNITAPSTASGNGEDRKTELQEQLVEKDQYNSLLKKKIIPGFYAFQLNDTYGFPIDLTNLLAQEEGWSVDMSGFQQELEKQKDRSRAATAIDTEDWITLKEGKVKFVGYDQLEAKTKVLRYRKIKSEGKESYQLVLDTTPFYAESGGQVGDKGVILINDETGAEKRIIVTDTKRDNELIIHYADSIPADISGEVTARVDKEKRKKTELHHSATHLLHAALRKVLGTHVTQKGSLVNDEYLRFDFSHFAKVSDEELAQVEALVNEKVRENIPVVIKQMSKDEALKSGAMALFGEKSVGWVAPVSPPGHTSIMKYTRTEVRLILFISSTTTSDLNNLMLS